MTVDTAKLKLDKANVQLLMDKRLSFFASVLFKLKQKITTDVPTAATDGSGIAFNPDFVDSLDVMEVLFLEIHEVWHVSLMHMFRIKQMKAAYPELTFYQHNCLADFEVNCLCRKYGMKLPKGSLLPEDFDFPADLTYEEYCKLLVDSRKEEDGSIRQDPSDGDPSSESGGSSGSPGDKPEDGEPEDDESEADGSQQDPDGESESQSGGGSSKFDPLDKEYPGQFTEAEGTEEEVRDLESEVKRTIQDAAAAAKVQGNMNASLAEVFGVLIAPKVDWKHRLRDFIQRSVTGRGGKQTFARRNRMRSGGKFMYPGRIPQEVGKLVILQDVSGSFKYSEAQDSWAYIKQMKEELSFELVVIQHSVDVVDVAIYERHDSDINIKSYGGGGTSHHAAFEEAAKHSPKAILCFTDLYTQFPYKKPNVPVLWLTYEQSHREVPWGTVSIMERAER